jgi:hypothetical protein
VRFFLSLLFFVALAGDAPRKVVVLVYFPTDVETRTSADKAMERLRAKACGYEVIDIEIDTDEKYADAITNKLKDRNIPATAPIFLHGHGMDDKDGDHAFIARKPKLDLKSKSLLPRQLVKGKDVLKTVRETLKYNPVWVASCRSGTACFTGDVCSGASCLKTEDSYAFDGDPVEGTLSEMVKLLCDPKKFREVSGDLGVLTPDRLNAHFCKVFGERTTETLFTEEEKDKLEKATEAAKKKFGDANVKTRVKDKLTYLVVTERGAACLTTESGKTQAPQFNNFRLYLPDYVPKEGEMEGKLRPADEKSHAK